MLQSLVGITHALAQSVNVLLTTHNGEAVTHLQRQVGACQQFYTSTIDAGNVHLVTLMETDGTDLAAVEFVIGDDNALAHDTLGGCLKLPVKVHMRTNHRVKDILIVGTHDNA